MYTSIEPEEEWLVGGVVGGLEEPIEERPAVALVHGHVAGELAEAHRRLPGEAHHLVGLLLPQSRRLIYSQISRKITSKRARQ